MRTIRIAVAGTGYVGLVTAAVLAHVGHDVVGVDVDEERVRTLNSGGCPIFEPGLPELLEESRDNLTFTLDYREACADADVVFIAVPTPERVDGSANLKYVFASVEQVAEAMGSSCVVVVKSTVPIGTGDRVQRHLATLLAGTGREVEVVANPEFLSQGTAVKDMLHASRVIIGVESERAREVMARVYADLPSPLLFMERRSAEMVKYASNNFLALKIAYINEIANLCDLLGADIDDVARGMGADPRIGDKFLRAGIGYGGSCFPKDTKALHWLSSFHDREIKTVKAAIEVNAVQKISLIKRAHRYHSDFEGLTVAVLGLAFKPGTDDLREAPSLDNVAILLDAGADVRVWDPYAMDNFKRFYPDEVTYCASIPEALADADMCLILTEWPDVLSLDPAVFVEQMRHPLVLDGRNCYALDEMARHALVYESIGRRTVGTAR